MRVALRPLPLAIVAMSVLAGVKTINVLHAIGIAPPARASTPSHSPAPPAKESPPPRPVRSEPAKPAPPAPESAVTDAERAALGELRARRSQLEARAGSLDEREALLAAAERRLTQRVTELSVLQAKLEQLEHGRREREDANWRGLVKTYEAMRPRDAAAIFNDLEGNVLMEVLDRMKEAKAAPILAAMAPERARAATAQLAQWRTKASAAPRLDDAAQGRTP